MSIIKNLVDLALFRRINDFKEYEAEMEGGAVELLKSNPELFFALTKEKYGFMLTYYIYATFVMFPIYIGFCASIFLFDNYQNINARLYDFLHVININVPSPKGWNFSFILSFIFNLFIFIFFIKKIDLRWVKKITKIRRRYFLSRYIGRGIFLTVLYFYFFKLTPIVTTPVIETNVCTLYSLCWLRTGDLFFNSSLMIYLAHLLMFILLFHGFFGENLNPKFLEIRKGL